MKEFFWKLYRGRQKMKMLGNSQSVGIMPDQTDSFLSDNDTSGSADERRNMDIIYLD